MSDTDGKDKDNGKDKGRDRAKDKHVAPSRDGKGKQKRKRKSRSNGKSEPGTHPKHARSSSKPAAKKAADSSVSDSSADLFSSDTSGLRPQQHKTVKVKFLAHNAAASQSGRKRAARPEKDTSKEGQSTKKEGGPNEDSDDSSVAPPNETQPERKRRLNRNNERKKRAKRISKIEDLTSSFHGLTNENQSLKEDNEDIRAQIARVKKYMLEKEQGGQTQGLPKAANAQLPGPSVDGAHAPFLSATLKQAPRKSPTSLASETTLQGASVAALHSPSSQRATISGVARAPSVDQNDPTGPLDFSYLSKEQRMQLLQQQFARQDLILRQLREQSDAAVTTSNGRPAAASSATISSGEAPAPAVRDQKPHAFSPVAFESQPTGAAPGAASTVSGFVDLEDFLQAMKTVQNNQRKGNTMTTSSAASSDSDNVIAVNSNGMTARIAFLMDVSNRAVSALTSSSSESCPSPLSASRSFYDIVQQQQAYQKQQEEYHQQQDQHRQQEQRLQQQQQRQQQEQIQQQQQQLSLLQRQLQQLQHPQQPQPAPAPAQQEAPFQQQRHQLLLQLQQRLQQEQEQRLQQEQQQQPQQQQRLLQALHNNGDAALIQSILRNKDLVTVLQAYADNNNRNN